MIDRAWEVLAVVSVGFALVFCALSSAATWYMCCIAAHGAEVVVIVDDEKVETVND